MLDISFILENRDIVRKAIEDKKKDPVDLDQIASLYEKRSGLFESISENNRQRKIAAESRDVAQGSALKQSLAGDGG